MTEILFGIALTALLGLMIWSLKETIAIGKNCTGCKVEIKDIKKDVVNIESRLDIAETNIGSIQTDVAVMQERANTFEGIKG